MTTSTRAASHRSRKIRPWPPEIGCGPVWHDRRPPVVRCILSTTKIRVPFWHAAQAAILPCYQVCLMTQKRLDARLSKVFREELEAVCRRQALISWVTRRTRRRDRMEMKAISMKATRCPPCPLEDGVQPPVVTNPCQRAFNHPPNASGMKIPP